MNVVIVGHGPSIYSGLGSVIDSMTVVRLKRGLVAGYDLTHWGSRTDYLCARSPRFNPTWLWDTARDAAYTPHKPTTGLCAVLEAVERLSPSQIFVIGFDRLMHPEVADPPHTWLAHDKWNERRILKSLGVKELG